MITQKFHSSSSFVMDFDWEKEFGKIGIPYASEFVEEHRTKKRLEDVNIKFNQEYENCTSKSDTKLKFSEKIIVVIFDDCEGVEYLISSSLKS